MNARRGEVGQTGNRALVLSSAAGGHQINFADVRYPRDTEAACRQTESPCGGSLSFSGWSDARETGGVPVATAGVRFREGLSV